MLPGGVDLKFKLTDETVFTLQSRVPENQLGKSTYMPIQRYIYRLFQLPLAAETVVGDCLCLAVTFRNGMFAEVVFLWIVG